MTQPIEARLRIVAETAQAAGAVKALQSNVDSLKGGSTLSQAGRELDRAATTTSAAATKAQTAVKKTADDSTRALRQTSNQIRAVTQQLPDIVSGLATGQSPFNLLIQQGTQIVEVSGGVGNAFRGLGAVFTATRVLALAAAGGVAALVTNIVQGALESDRLRKTLALTGNAANTSLGELDALARKISETQSASIGSVREALASVVASGNYVGQSVESAARTVTAFNKLTGASADETLKQLSALDNGVAEGAAKLNRTYNFLTAEQFKYVRSLEAQGRTQEATRFVLDELTATINQRAAPAVGTLEKAWNGVKRAVSGALDALKEIGRDKTPEDRIAELTKRLAELQALENQRAAGRNNSGIRRERIIGDIAATQAELDALQRQRNSDLLRRAEASIAQQAAQTAIEEERKSQDSISQVAAAGAQKRLAQELAYLERKRAAIELANAQGLVSERDYSLALNRIEQQRMAAQLKAIDQQRAAVAGKRVGSPDEARAQAAELTRIDANRIAAVAALEAKRTEARTIADREALERARSDASEWAQIWTRAAGQVRQLAQETAAAQARLLADPAERAAAEADAATAALRRDLADLERDLEIRIQTLAITPEAKAELIRQLQDLQAVGGQAVDERTRQAMLGSLSQIFAERQAQLQAREAAINTQVAIGVQTQADGEREILALRQQQIPVLEEILAKMEAMASSPEDKSVIANLRAQLSVLGDLRTEFEITARSAGINALSTALNGIVTGAKTGKQALLDMVGSFAQAMLDVLNRRLAEQLVAQFAAAASNSGGGNFLSTIGSFVAGLFHTGGVVGETRATVRAVNPAVFALAPRYHAGGVAGLLPNEVPLIAEKGETIRTVEQERSLQRRLQTGGVIITNQITVTGQSDDVGARAFADDVQRAQEAAIEQTIVKHMRPGGLLSGLRTGG